MPTRLLRALVFCAVLSLTLTHAYGGVKTWTSTTGGSWSNGGNWTPNGVPGPTDLVYIYNTGGAVVNLDSGNAAIYTLWLGSSSPGPQAVLEGNGLTNLTIEEEMTISQSGNLELQAGDVITQSDPDSYFSNYGVLYVSAGARLDTPFVDRAFEVYAGSSFDIEGSFTTGYFSLLNEIDAGAGGVAAGELYLMNGQVWNISPSSGTLSNSGILTLGNGTTLNVSGDVVNNLLLDTGFLPGTSGGNSLTIDGTLTNNGYFDVEGNDKANITWLDNHATVRVEHGATLTLQLGIQPGIVDIPANSSFGIFGTFNQTYNTSSPSAFYNLQSIEGSLELGNGQTTNITPTSGTLLLTSGILGLDSGSILNLHGLLDLDKNSNFSVSGLGGLSVANLDSLNNNGLVTIENGATLNLTKQPNGITDIVAGSTFNLYGGTFTAGALSGFNSLTSVEGTLILGNGSTIVDNPIGGTLYVDGGYVEVQSGTTLTIPGGLLIHSVTSLGGVLSINDPGPTTVNIGGTLTNLGGQINVFGPQAVLNAGSIVNGGMLSLPEGSKVNVANGFYQLAAGTLGEAIGASGFSILVSADGQVMLAGTLDVMLDPGFDPAIGTTYEFIVFQPGELSGTFASIQNEYFNGTEKWIVIYDNAGGYVELEAAPAPEPTSLLLLGTGLLAIGSGVRRRRR